ncbi:MAG: helix-turn-helix domain-containing protein [Eubacteriales bacterium]|nr:helix-turn-helix domain-containing protein [Eubacteriales bacterium]
MYRMLIVDDEPDVLEALQAVFTAREDLELDILTASSAPEALAVLDRERLDILLSDICMPGMDGLELQRRVRANWPGCRTIFLSGYTEFSYIYQAEQLEAVSYLLKTESRQRIVDTVRRTIAQLDEANRVSRLEQLADRAQVDRPYILRSLMEALIQDGRPEALARLIRKLQPDFDPDRPLQLALGRINGSEKPDHEQKARFFLLLEELAKHHLGSHFKLLVGEAERWIILFLLQSGIEEPDKNRQTRLMRGSFEAVQNILLEQAGCCMAVAIDTAEHELKAVRPAYEQLRSLLDTELGYGAGIRLIGSGEPSTGILADEGQAVAMVRSIIEQQYDRPLSLTGLAEKVYLNPSYLSRLFRRETGTTLIQYLNQIRMTHACALLVSSNMKISDIAAQTGYESPSYFNQAFRKHTGMSPMAYRQQKLETTGDWPLDNGEKTVK